MSRWLFRCALRLVPASWRETVRVDLEMDARAEGKSAAWATWQALRVAAKLRGLLAGGTVMSDLRDAIRRVRRSPVFSLVTILTLGVGIGLNVAVFSVADGMLFKPLPYGDPSQLVRILQWDKNSRRAAAAVGPAVVDGVRQGSATVGDLATVDFGTSEWSAGPDDASPMRVLTMSVNGLRVLQVAPVTGRTFQPGDESISPRPALMSYGTWQQRFAGDPAIVGRTLVFDGHTAQVIGVLPRFLPLPSITLKTRYDLVLPGRLPDPRSGALAPFARLKPGAAIAAADEELNRINDRPDGETSRGRDTDVRVSSLQFSVSELRRPSYITLVAAALLVLLVAGVNLVSLLLARGESRRSELAVRAALGGSRWRVARMLLAEAVVLSTAGGTVAWILAAVSYHGIFNDLPVDYRTLMGDHLEWRVFAFAIVVTVLVAVTFAAVTAMQASQSNLQVLLARGGRSSAGGRAGRRSGATLLMVEAALAVIVVIGAILLVASFEKLSRVNLGFDPEGLSLVYGNLPRTAGEAHSEQLAKSGHLLDELSRIPNMTVAIADSVPWAGQLGNTSAREGDVRGTLVEVSASFFQVMGARVVEGRLPTADELTGRLPVAVINETGAQAVTGDRVVGRHVQSPGVPAYEIVGVIADMRPNHQTPSAGTIFVPLGEEGMRSSQVIVRSTVAPDRLATAITAAFRTIDPATRRVTVSSAFENLDPWLKLPRVMAALFVVFAGATLLIGALGIAGLLLYTIEQRRFELGIRMALGADAHRIRRHVVRQGVQPVVIGLIVGSTASWWSATAIQSLLFEMQVHDVRAYVASALVLVSVAWIAASIPARRAARTDPAVVLRAQ